MEINMLDMKDGPFDRLLSFAEAAEIWKIDSSTLRKAVSDGRLVLGRDCRKFGKQWVVTVDAMAREFRGCSGGYMPWSEHLTNLRKARNEEEEALVKKAMDYAYSSKENANCENCKYLSECPEEWIEQSGGNCENYESI